MCGIVGYLGNENSTQFVIEGLTLLQNRGYDSVGISSIIENQNQLKTIKYALILVRLGEMILAQTQCLFFLVQVNQTLSLTLSLSCLIPQELLELKK